MLNQFKMLFTNKHFYKKERRCSFMEQFLPDKFQERTIITVKEACEILHITKNTLYELLRIGEIRAFKLQRKWMIPSKSILEYIKDSLEY